MKIARVLGPKFEDSEFKEPYDALAQAGHRVTVAGLEAIPASIRESLQVPAQVPARR